MTTDPLEQPVDNARVSRLSSPQQGDEAADTSSRFDDSFIREERNLDSDDMPPMKQKPLFQQMPSRAYRPRSYSTLRVTEDERLWASAAHASAWLTFIGGIVSGGAILPFSVFIPLIIYFLFRRKSDYVAFHALQAFVVQLLGVVGAVVLLFVGGTVWGVGMVIALLSMVILVGFVLVPLWGLVGVVLLLAACALPIAMLLFASIAAVATYNGGDYQYPYIARWVDRQLAGGFLNAA
ncbi:MAG: DUF4870 domain-containing protein [Anaerolineae bacterium]